METLILYLNPILHLDTSLYSLLENYGNFTYGLLFLIIFCETGLILTPFLPGDSLLFAAGTLASLGKINIYILIGTLICAAILGNGFNYTLGNYVSSKSLHNPKSKLLNPKYLNRAQAFYNYYGGMAIIVARFIPIIRTFAPFIAGMGRMNSTKFWSYNITGAILWVGLVSSGGYLFGNIPGIKDHFTLVILGTIGISVLPLVFATLRRNFNLER